MTDDTAPNEYDVEAHLRDIGLLCVQWPYLEWLLEVTVWWLLGLIDGSNDGREITGGFGAEALARKAAKLAHRKVTDPAELDAIKEVAARVKDTVDERHLAVHGVREVRPDESVFASVARGKLKNRPQPMPMERLQKLNIEVMEMINIVEPLLAKHGAITGSGPASESPP
jgi:hypothetical protein